MEFRHLGVTGFSISAVGMGTWAMWGRTKPAQFSDEDAVETLRLGLELGMTLIDTAEMYGNGHSEEIVSRAVEGRREDVFLATKVSPQHFAYDDVLHSARRSLNRLKVGHIDLYQLHWPNPSIPITDTMKAMEKLANDGLVRHIGVSNFSVKEMNEAQAALSKHEIVSNQVEYNLLERRVEKNVLPYCKEHKITVIAYSPLGQGRIPNGEGEAFTTLDRVAKRLGKTRCQVALSWLLHDTSVIVIPKAIRKQHARENAEVADWKLSTKEYETLSKAFE